MEDARNLSDRELLVLTYESVYDLKTAVYGNGRPGLMQEFEVLKTKVEERTTPSKSAALGLSGGLTVLIMALSEFIKQRMGQ